MKNQLEIDTSFLPSKSRSDLQLGRRILHLSTGFIVATIYMLALQHQQLVYILGAIACIVYLFEQIRISYPELAPYLKLVNIFMLRAEEQLKESAALPYVIGLLLTILTFPKTPAVIAIYTLAVADPMSAIVGISLGKHYIGPRKTLEGTLAFFVSSFLCTFFALYMLESYPFWSNFKLALIIGFFAGLCDLIPLRLDDNLTIPLFTATMARLILSI